MTEPLLRIRNVSKIFGDIPVVDRVDLTVSQGEIVMIIGPFGVRSLRTSFIWTSMKPWF